MKYDEIVKKRMLQAIAFFVLLLFHPSAIAFTTYMDEGEEVRCVDYEPVVVKLTGTMKKETHPGLPNFFSVEEGDEPLEYWFLYLEEPICLLENPDTRMMDYEEFNVKKLQIVITDNLTGGYPKHQYLLNKKVTVTGTLYHSHTGWHKTRILIVAHSIKYAGK